MLQASRECFEFCFVLCSEGSASDLKGRTQVDGSRLPPGPSVPDTNSPQYPQYLLFKAACGLLLTFLSKEEKQHDFWLRMDSLRSPRNCLAEALPALNSWWILWMCLSTLLGELTVEIAWLTRPLPVQELVCVHEPMSIEEQDLALAQRRVVGATSQKLKTQELSAKWPSCLIAENAKASIHYSQLSRHMSLPQRK